MNYFKKDKKVLLSDFCKYSFTYRGMDVYFYNFYYDTIKRTLSKDRCYDSRIDMRPQQRGLFLDKLNVKEKKILISCPSQSKIKIRDFIDRGIEREAKRKNKDNTSEEDMQMTWEQLRTYRRI